MTEKEVSPEQVFVQEFIARLVPTEKERFSAKLKQICSDIAPYLKKPINFDLESAVMHFAEENKFDANNITPALFSKWLDFFGDNIISQLTMSKNKRGYFSMDRALEEADLILSDSSDVPTFPERIDEFGVQYRIRIPGTNDDDADKPN
ncbi:MAG: hypothetical protein ABII98_03065 [bacterium]